jgi:uncharacterized protein with beta-barrel porin domain
MFTNKSPKLFLGAFFIIFTCSTHAQSDSEEDEFFLIIGGGGGGGGGAGGGGAVSAGSSRTLFDIEFLEERLSNDEPAGGSAGEQLDKRTSLFAGANYERNERPNTSLETGFDADSTGVVLGVDHRFGDEWVFGGFLDQQSEDADFKSNAGFQDMDETGVAAFLYRFLGQEGFYSVMVRYGDQDYDIQRDTLAGSALGDTGGSRFNLSGAYGVDRDWGTAQLNIQGLVDYERTRIDAYTAIAGGVPVTFSEDDIDSLTASVRVAVSTVKSVDFGVLVPQAFVELVHEFENDSRTITTSVGDVFTTEDPDRNWFTLGANTAVVWPHGWSGFVNLEGDVARSDQDRLRIEVGVRREF